MQLEKKQFVRVKLVSLCLCALWCLPLSSSAQFTFDFEIIGGGTTQFDCGTGGAGGFACNFGPSVISDRFVQEVITIDGEAYTHQVIGSLASGFALEIFLLNSKVEPGTQCNDMTCITDGSPTHNPTAVAMKQVTSEASGANTFYDEFLKDRLDYKARTRQVLNWDAVNIEFEIDARSELLSVMPTESVPVTNRMSINSPDIPVSIVNGKDFTEFDINDDSDQMHSVGSSYYYDEPTNTFNYVEF